MQESWLQVSCCFQGRRDSWGRCQQRVGEDALPRALAGHVGPSSGLAPSGFALDVRGRAEPWCLDPHWALGSEPMGAPLLPLPRPF